MATTVNNMKNVAVAYGSIPAALATLIALGTTYTYQHLMVVSTLDTDVVIKIGDNEVTFPANKNVTVDNFPFNGTLTYKYASAPSSGGLYVFCY